MTKLERFVGDGGTDGGTVSQQVRTRNYKITDTALLTYAYALEDVIDGGKAPDYHRTGNYSVQGTNLVVAETCPFPGTTDRWPFTVFDAGLKIHREEDLVETLTTTHP